MTPTRVAVLTPPGSAAIAVLSLRGPRAWEIIRSHFRTGRGSSLPVDPLHPALWFGRFGGEVSDEVILASRVPELFELHCHGGRRVVHWLLTLLRSNGVEEVAWSDEEDPKYGNPLAAAILPFARTVRTAGILLDQANGAYDRAVELVAKGGSDAEAMCELLRRNSPIGRHLVEPWTVAIAGAPNAGKSTLLNALAGFDRSIVSPIPGTTRDAVSVSVAFDGWPVDLIDTAGLRESSDLIEGEGIARARQAVTASDLCVWLVDATGSLPRSLAAIAGELDRVPGNTLIVFNKCDLVEVPAEEMMDAPQISAATGTRLSELATRIASMLVPNPPQPGDPVPFTPNLCNRWS
jgi:tRNA modification GTPase